jgi:hypothetical protein
MRNRYYTGLMLAGACVLVAQLTLPQSLDPAFPSQGCHARLTALDHARFERAGSGMRFDGTLLFRSSSLHIEGMLTMGKHAFRLHRQVIWTRNWLTPTHWTLSANHIYFGDTLPSNVAAQLPLFGEPVVELTFTPVDAQQFAVFANGVFFTYCRRI